MTDKEKAKEFLCGLEKYLNKKLAPPEIMRGDMGKLAGSEKKKKEDDKRKKGETTSTKRQYEGIFLNKYITPKIHEYLTNLSMSEEDAKGSLLTESWGSLKEKSSGSPTRGQNHLFTKEMGKTASETAKCWAQKVKNKKAVGTNPCPDIALTEPFEHKIVIEGKYHKTAKMETVEIELVKTLYEAFFYLGVPNLSNSSWNYDYACALIYDSSDEGDIQKACDNFGGSSFRDTCWSGSNIYLMILRGK